MPIISMNPGNIAEGIHLDKADGTITVFTQQDVGAIIEDSKGEHRQFDERSPWKKEINRVASIPLGVVAELKRQGIWFDRERLAKWLDDPDNAAFRTRPGKVGRMIGNKR